MNTFWNAALLVILSSLFILLASAQTTQPSYEELNHFIIPGPSDLDGNATGGYPMWKNGSVQEITWVTESFEYYNFLYQGDSVNDDGPVVYQYGGTSFKLHSRVRCFCFP